MRTDTPFTQEHIKELNKVLNDALVQCGQRIIKWNEDPIKQIVPWKYYTDINPKFIPSICQVYEEPKLTKWQKIKRWLRKIGRRFRYDI